MPNYWKSRKYSTVGNPIYTVQDHMTTMAYAHCSVLFNTVQHPLFYFISIIIDSAEDATIIHYKAVQEMPSVRGLSELSYGTILITLWKLSNAIYAEHCYAARNCKLCKRRARQCLSNISVISLCQEPQ